MNDKILKIRYTEGGRSDGLSQYPYNILPYLPDCDCAFDLWRVTVGFDIFPFAITTRINSASEVFLKVYEEENAD